MGRFNGFFATDIFHDAKDVNKIREKDSGISSDRVGVNEELNCFYREIFETLSLYRSKIVPSPPRGFPSSKI